MNSKLLGASLAAIFAIALVGSPIMAEAITDLVKTKLKIDDDEYEKITFKLASKIPKVPTGSEIFGGYAVFTDGHVIAVTAHEGAFDSETQSFPTSGTFGLCDADQVAAGFCSGVWHTHLVEPVGNENCAFAAVGALTFEEPSDDVKIKAKKIVLKEIEMETDDYTNSITGQEMDFTAGNPVDADPSTPEFDGAAFDLTPVFIDGNLAAICIGPEA